MSKLNICSNAGQARVRLGIVLSAILIISSVIIFSSCGAEPGRLSEQAPSKEKAVSDSVSSYIKGIVTDTINGITHNFIRKATMKFKVDDVINASKQIEDLVSNYGGYISNSELNSNKGYSKSVQTTKDSIVESTPYLITNHITAKVPNKKMDTVLRQISDLAKFIDFRHLKSDDVKLKLFSNQLAENRYKNYKTGLQKNAQKVTTKQPQALSTEENILEKQALADANRIDAYSLADEVNYSDIQLEIYQPEKTLIGTMAIPKNINSYKPSFFIKFRGAVSSGFEILKGFILFIANAWGIILILLGFFFLIKWLIAFITKKVNAS
jgi:hypothetical protein